MHTQEMASFTVEARCGSVARSSRRWPTPRDGSDRLTEPTLVIHGADDELVPATISVPLGELPNVDRKVFAGLRHEMHNEPESEMVLAYVVAWVRGQLAARA